MFCLLAGMFALISCERVETYSAVPDEGLVAVEFRVGSNTKASPGHIVPAGNLDSNVGNYLLLLFNADGSLYARQFVTGSAAVTVAVCKEVEYHIYAVANLDTAGNLYASLNAVMTEDGFLGTSYLLSDAWLPGKGWLASNPEGLVRTFTGQSGTVVLGLDRVVAKVIVALPSFACVDCDPSYFSIDGLYLINTVSEATFGGEAVRYCNCSCSPVSMFADNELCNGDLDFDLDDYSPAGGDYRDSSEDYVIRSDESDEYLYDIADYDGEYCLWDETFTFYCLGNPMQTTTYGKLDPFSGVARQTRTVMNIYDWESENFIAYPVTLKDADGILKANSCYTVDYSVNLDSKLGPIERTRRDGMDWDTGSILFGSFDIGPWDTGGTYAENL